MEDENAGRNHNFGIPPFNDVVEGQNTKKIVAVFERPNANVMIASGVFILHRGPHFG
jgi:hypothetical protein